MRTRILLSIGALALAILACSLVGGGGDDEIPDVSQAVNPDTEPVRVSLSVDESRAVSAEVPIEGGTLTATGADGAVFTLEIPSGALLQATTITMTPITSMEGLPSSGGLAAAVELKPDGLNFYEIVTLTIDLPQAIPLEEQIPIGVSGAEHNLEFAFADVENGSFRLQLLHFSSGGVAKGTLADLEPVRQRLGGDVEARLRSVAAREVAYVRQRQLAGDENANLTPQFIDWYVRTFRENVLNPRLDAAEDSCAAGRLALLTYVEFQRTLQLLGAPDALEGMSQLVLDLIPSIAHQCITEEYELCRDEHIVHHILLAIQELERQFQLLGLEGAAIDQVRAEAEDLAKKCLHFELVFSSEATQVLAGLEDVSEVSSTILLTYQPGEMEITGEAPLENVRFDYQAPPIPGCTYSGDTGAATTFRVTALNLKVVHDGPDDLLGHVEDILLGFAPGGSHEMVNAVCQGTSYPPQEFPLWTMTFMQVHSDQLQAAQNIGGFLASGWSMEGGELFAELSWDRSSIAGSEKGSFELYHRPQ